MSLLPLLTTGLGGTGSLLTPGLAPFGGGSSSGGSGPVAARLPILAAAVRQRRLTAVPLTVGTYYDDIYTAIVAYLRATAALTSAFPGGIVGANAASRQGYPYLRVGDVQPLAKDSAEDGRASLTITGYALTGDAAKQATALAANYLTGALPTTPRDAFLFDEAGEHWQDAGAVRANDGRLGPAFRGPDGVKVWSYTEQIDFWLVKQ